MLSSSPTHRSRSRLPRRLSIAFTPIAPEDFLEFRAPRVDQVDQPLRADVGIEAPRERRVLGGDAPRAPPGVAPLAERAAQRQQRRRAERHRVRAQRDRLRRIRRSTGCRPPRSAETWLRMPFVPQLLIDHRERDLDRDAEVVADHRRRRPGAAAETVEVDDVRARPGRCRWQSPRRCARPRSSRDTGFS